MNRITRGFFAVILLVTFSSASGQYASIYGGPTWDQATKTGYGFPLNPFNPQNPDSSVLNGVAAAAAVSRIKNGVQTAGDNTSVRWDTTSWTELGNLGLTNAGTTDMRGNAVDNSGRTIGYATKYVSGTNLGKRAVIWNAAGVPTELGNLGLSSAGTTSTIAQAINSSGTIVGSALQFVNGLPSGGGAVRWDSSNNPTLLGTIGTSTDGLSFSTAFAINDAGVVVGYASKYVSGSYVATVPVRWDASGAMTELGTLGASSNLPVSGAVMVNASGVAAGFATKYVAGLNKGSRAVRWDASATEATELDNLGLSLTTGQTTTKAYAINSSGAIAGDADKQVSGQFKGTRAVRWDAAGTGVTELGLLTTHSDGWGFSEAFGMNDAGQVVGYVNNYDESHKVLNTKGVIWGPDGLAIPLETMIDPSSGWTTIERAFGISNDGWIVGVGTFDPDGGGPLSAYSRAFTMQLPEPMSGLIFGLAAISVAFSRRSSTDRRNRKIASTPS